ncbi:branched-chain amino acid transaminase [Accumulibacter sp.]|uniref:branched-chain amino acid transaminase n=1 Tax=Accumulibacter sp. TaxID=2053492 RepID=UPI001ACCD8E6|nr:branched-chain amino acid transaminase [Accumulibacter sp.]MBN8453063.1 branched-chain amino acid transaminase [Accumulibacter sp.]
MSGEDQDGWIWLDGAFVPWREARVHVLTHTLHYGLGVFEGIRAYATASGPAIFRLDEHLQRLLESAHILGLAHDFDHATLADACRRIVARNRLEAGYIRPLLFLGAEKVGLDPVGARVHAMIAAWPWRAYLGERALDDGIRVKVSSFARHHVNVQMCRAKSVSTYTNSILASREARADGYDEALLLDTAGFVAEGASENLFLVRRGTLLEPEVSSALDGITRRSVIDIASDMGLPVVARRITRDELYCADEVLLTGTAAEITPVVEVDRRRVGDGRPGPLTRKLQRRYFDCVHGRDEARATWLSPVAEHA